MEAASARVRTPRELSGRQLYIGFLEGGVFQCGNFQGGDWMRFQAKPKDWRTFELRDWWGLTGFQTWKQVWTFYPTGITQHPDEKGQD